MKKSSKTKEIISVSTAQRKKLRQFEKIAGLRFKKQELLSLAFSHRSLTSDYGDLAVANNEKLEFLGDSVLGLVITEYLFRLLPEENEGRLAKIKSYVVSEDSLARIATSLKISEYIFVGRSEELSGGRFKKTILADALEALIGAFYLDAGFKRAQDFVLRCCMPEINKVLEGKHQRDYKTLLQEYVQKKHKTYPHYQLVKKTGPDHAKIFWIHVKIQDQVFGPVSGKSKKEAEKQAAELAYKHIQSV